MKPDLETANSTTVVELSPSYKIPVFLTVAAIPLGFVSVWLGGAIALFGLFLTIQAATLRLQFTEKALDIYRSGTIIRNFPYSEWLNWQIFFGIQCRFCFTFAKLTASTFYQLFSLPKPWLIVCKNIIPAKENC